MGRRPVKGGAQGTVVGFFDDFFDSCLQVLYLVFRALLNQTHLLLQLFTQLAVYSFLDPKLFHQVFRLLASTCKLA